MNIKGRRPIKLVQPLEIPVDPMVRRWPKALGQHVAEDFQFVRIVWQTEFAAHIVRVDNIVERNDRWLAPNV